jgi:transcriptional regulator with XRE-family HTH domain
VSIGEALAEARRGAGLTVAQVSQRTRIREAIITGIEGDDYSACGGDFYARGHIRAIARAAGADPELLIRQYDTALRGPPPLPADESEPVTLLGEYDMARRGPLPLPADVTEPVTPGRGDERRQLIWTAALGLALVVALGFVAYHFLAGSRHGASIAPRARTHPATRHHASHGTPAPASARAPTTRGAVPARTLTPASARAFGAYGTGQGDNPQGAHLAIDGSPVTAWHTDWYTTARFGNLYPGTGLLVDMGRPVTITAAQIGLGRAHGARFQLRAGAAPALADLPPVASAANASGLVRLRLTTPAHGRYVLIWFTRLPPDPAGTFQASVHDLRLEGRP